MLKLLSLSLIGFLSYFVIKAVLKRVALYNEEAAFLNRDFKKDIILFAPTKEKIIKQDREEKVISIVVDNEFGNKPETTGENKEIEYLAISVFARKKEGFALTTLIDYLATLGIKLNKEGIFCWKTSKGEAIFSIVNALSPGKFITTNIRQQQVKGVVLYMNNLKINRAKLNFSLMLKTAKQLANKLNGELRDGLKTPLTKQIIASHEARLETILEEV